MPPRSNRRTVLRSKRVRDDDFGTPDKTRHSGTKDGIASVVRALEFNADDGSSRSGSTSNRRSSPGNSPSSSSSSSPPSSAEKPRSAALRAAQAAMGMLARASRPPTQRKTSSSRKPRKQSTATPKQKTPSSKRSKPASAANKSPASPTSTPVPSRVEGRFWPEGLSPASDLQEPASSASTSVEEALELADAIAAAFRSSLPRVNGLEMQNLEAVSQRAQTGRAFSIHGKCVGSRAAFLALFRPLVAATATARAPVKRTGFGVFARTASSAGKPLPLSEAADKWARLTEDEQAVYEARADDEHLTDSAALCHRMDAQGLVADIDLSTAGMQLASPASVRIAEEADDSLDDFTFSSSSSSSSAPPTPSRQTNRKASPLLNETSTALLSRKNALLCIFRSPSICTNVPLFTAMTVTGRSTLWATLTPRITVAFQADGGRSSSSSSSSSSSELGTITITAKTVFRWGAPPASTLDSFQVADATRVPGAAMPRKAPASPSKASTAGFATKPTARRRKKGVAAPSRVAPQRGTTSLEDLAAALGMHA